MPSVLSMLTWSWTIVWQMNETLIYNKDIKKAVGDMAERSVYDILKEFFKEREETVLIIQGLDILNIDPIISGISHVRHFQRWLCFNF